MKAWILAARPKTLSAGIVPVLMATAYAFFQDRMHFPSAVLAALGAIAIQIATNYINDGADYLRGADTQERLGPPRMAQQGLLSPRSLFIGAGICFLFAALAGAYLIHRAGWPLVWIGLFSMVCAIAYTAGPMPLAYFGLGDLFVLVFFGFIAVGGAFFTQTLQLDLTVLILGAIAGLQGVSLIAVNNIRDIPTDKKAGKKTFAVLIGEENAKAEYLLSALIPFLLMVLLAIYWADSRLLLPLILLPLVYKNCIQMVRIKRDENVGQAYNKLLANSARLQILFGLFTAAAFLWAHKS